MLPNHKTLLERLEKEDNETTWRVDFKATLEYLITAQHIKNVQNEKLHSYGLQKRTRL